jgi:hypothetical protein
MSYYARCRDKKVSRVNALEVFLSGVLPEEGSPPPSSTPDIKTERAVQAILNGSFFSPVEGAPNRAVMRVK